MGTLKSLRIIGEIDVKDDIQSKITISRLGDTLDRFQITERIKKTPLIDENYNCFYFGGLECILIGLNICDLIGVYASNYHEGQFSEIYEIFGRLYELDFNPRTIYIYESLSENGQ